MTIQVSQPAGGDDAFLGDDGWIADQLPAEHPHSQNLPRNARDRAIALVPELAANNWTDTYFEHSEHEIIAVFDHSSRALRISAICSVICSMIFAVPLVVVVSVLLFSSWELVGKVIWLVFVSVITIRMLMTFWNVLSSSRPHTALTAYGIIHVDKHKTTFAFPFKGILDATQVGNLGCNLKLVNYQSYYQTQPVRGGGGSKHVQYSLLYLENAALLQKLVMAIKKEKREAILQSEPKDFSIDADPNGR